MTPAIMETETYWVELCIKEANRRFHDDRGRCSKAGSDLVLSDFRRGGFEPGVGVKSFGTTNGEQAA